MVVKVRRIIIYFIFQWKISKMSINRAGETSVELGTQSRKSCADPESFMRGGPTKMIIFGHRRGGGGSKPKKIPKLPFFR